MSLPRNPRYECLDAWRGVACLIVVLFHSTAGYIATPELEARVRSQGGSVSEWIVIVTSRLWVGVPLFFVISGYCIAASADSARNKPWSGGRFFYRRFRRIYPPLWAYLAIAAALISLLSPQALPGPTAAYPHPIPYPWEVSLGQWLGSITLTEEWRHYLIGPPRGYFSGQVWTLCYEEQFYFVVGVVVLLFRRWLFPILGVVTLLVFLNIADLNALFGNRIGLDLNRYRWPASGFFFDGLWLAFAAGVAVYYRTNYATPIIRWGLDGLLLAGLFWALQFIPSLWDFKPTLPGYLSSAFVCALLLGWFHRWDRVIAQAKLTLPLMWSGRMCYSLYLVHAPLTGVLGWNLYRWGVDSPLRALLITVPISTLLSLLVSYGFFRLIEKPFLNSPIRPQNEPHMLPKK